MNASPLQAAAERARVVAPAEVQTSAARGRLVVVVPDVAEPALLALRIHELAAARQQNVLLIGVASQSVPDAEMRRKLVLLQAFVREAGTTSELRVEKDLNWIPAFRLLLGEKDLLACGVADARPAAGEEWVELLTARFQRSLYVFMDSDHARSSRPRAAAQVAPWLASIAVIFGFLWIQIRLSQFGDAPMNTFLLVLSLVAEVGLIWFCNAFLG